MNILLLAHFVTDFDPHGTSRFVCLARRLGREHRVELVTSDFDHRAKETRRERDFALPAKVTLLPEPGYPKNICLRRLFSHWLFARRVRAYLKGREKPDAIYCAVPSLSCAFYAARYAEKNRIPFVIDVQDLWPEAFSLAVPGAARFLLRPLVRRAEYIYKSADIIVGVSETYCRRAARCRPGPVPCLPVYLGTDLARFDRWASSPVRRDPEKFILAYGGTLGHSYDIPCILEALALLKGRGTSVTLWVLGDGPLRGAFQARAEELGVEAVFYGRVPYPELCALLRACDVCVNPIVPGAAQSIINKHADYAAAGRPVISTQSSPEYRALLTRYRCGVNCPAGDAAAVAEAISYLMDHPGERRAMGERARQMAEDLFDREKTYGKILDLFSGEGSL